MGNEKRRKIVRGVGNPTGREMQQKLNLLINIMTSGVKIMVIL